MPESQLGLAEGNKQPLDRFELSTCLRRAGVDVDVNDWDGLTDDDVRQIVSTVGHNAAILRSPVVQMGINSALYCGDTALYERAADSGLFNLLMGGGHEV